MPRRWLFAEVAGEYQIFNVTRPFSVSRGTSKGARSDEGSFIEAVEVGVEWNSRSLGEVGRRKTSVDETSRF